MCPVDVFLPGSTFCGDGLGSCNDFPCFQRNRNAADAATVSLQCSAAEGAAVAVETNAGTKKRIEGSCMKKCKPSRILANTVGDMQHDLDQRENEIQKVAGKENKEEAGKTADIKRFAEVWRRRKQK